MNHASPRLPPDVRIYAVGDIHGRSDLLDLMLAFIDDDRRRRPIGQAIEIFLGDYVDRGADSRGVIDRVIQRVVGKGAVCLKGNHEQMMERALVDAEAFAFWLGVGGLETTRSYGAPAGRGRDRGQRHFAQAVPGEHLDFLASLRTSTSVGGYFFAHAGVAPGIPLASQHSRDLLWIRDTFLYSDEDFGKIVVHGHSPAPAPERRRNRINVDTGAYFSNRLSCAVLEGDGVVFRST